MSSSSTSRWGSEVKSGRQLSPCQTSECHFPPSLSLSLSPSSTHSPLPPSLSPLPSSLSTPSPPSLTLPHSQSPPSLTPNLHPPSLSTPPPPPPPPPLPSDLCLQAVLVRYVRAVAGTYSPSALSLEATFSDTLFPTLTALLRLEGPAGEGAGPGCDMGAWPADPSHSRPFTYHTLHTSQIYLSTLSQPPPLTPSTPHTLHPSHPPPVTPSTSHPPPLTPSTPHTLYPSHPHHTLHPSHPPPLIPSTSHTGLHPSHPHTLCADAQMDVSTVWQLLLDHHGNQDKIPFNT